MRTLRTALWILSLLALGCRTDPNTVLLERDLRLHEDRIYQLESMLEECCASREATLRENKSLKKELEGGDRGAGPGNDYRSPSVELPPRDSEPKSRPRRDETPKLEPPTIELPESTTTPPPEIIPGGKSTLISDAPPTELVINKRLTGGMNHDPGAGSDGVMVAFEPRDAAGHTVKGLGAVSVVVLDPAMEGEAGRVGRWDFEPHEVPSHFRNSPFGRGLQFELPWPGDPPKNRDLRLFVRFTTPEGKKIVADADIKVRTADDVANEDRKPKDRPESASRPPRKRAPTSRLKSPRVTLSHPREIAPIDQVEAAESSDLREESQAVTESEPVAESEPREEPEDSLEPELRVEPERREPTKQATRPDRPSWKPYR